MTTNESLARSLRAAQFRFRMATERYSLAYDLADAREADEIEAIAETYEER